MKILLTTHQFLPHFSSGTEILTFKTAKELQALGHEVHVFTGYPAQVEMTDDERFDSYVHDGIPVERFHHACVPMGGQSNVIEAEYNCSFFGEYFRKYLLKLKPDIVHFFHLGRLSASAIDVCSELNIPMVFTPTDFWFVCFMNQLRLTDHSLCCGPDRNRLNCLRHYIRLTQSQEIQSKVDKIPNIVLGPIVWSIKKGFFGSKWYSPYVKALVDRTDFLMSRLNKINRVLVPTRIMEKVLKENGLNSRISIFSPFGIDTVETVKKVKTYDGGTLRIGFIGTLYEHKGPHILLKALKLIHDAPVSVKLYGKLDDFPDYVSELRDIASDDKRVTFCGTFPNNEIGNIFESLDVLVVPSIWYENTPLVMYSAQASGCIVIASDVGGISEVIHHQENGLLFKPGDVDGLASCIKALLSDAGMLQRLSSNAKQPKSIVNYAREVDETYVSVINESKTA